MKKSNLISRLLSYSHEKQSPQRLARYAAMLILLLTLGFGQMWASQIDNTNWAKFYNTCTNSSISLSTNNNNKYTGRVYMPASSTYQVKIQTGKDESWSGWYRTDRDDAYTFTSVNNTYDGLAQRDGNDNITTKACSSGYVRVEVEFWGEYSKNSSLRLYQYDVDALSLSSLDRSSSTVASNGTMTVTPNTPGGGSGSYHYEYSCSPVGYMDGSTYHAPYVFAPTEVTITVTMTDDNSQLSGLASVQKSITVTVNRPDNMSIKHNWTGADDGWSWQTATGNGDGTYSYVGEYHASGCDWNVASSETNKSFIADGSCTKVGAPTSGDICTFKLAPTAWSVGGSKTASVTIIKRLAVTATKVSLGTGAGTAGTPSISASGYADGKVDYNTSVTFTAPAEASGYRWKGWYTNNTGTGEAYNTNKSFTETVTTAKTYYAIYEPITYTLTFHLNGGDSWGDLGSATNTAGTVTMSVTYDQVLNGLTMPHAIKNAYHFECWSKSNEWKSQYVWKYDYSVEPRIYHWYEYSGYVTKVGDNYYWKRAGNVDLYAYYDAPTLHNLSFTPRYVVPEGDVTATIRFSSVMGEPEGTYALCYKLMTAAGTALRVQPEWKDKDDAAHTVSFTAPASPGEYTIGIKLFPGSSATWDDTGQSYYFDGDVEKEVAAGKFEVEEMNAVTVSYKSGSVDVLSSTTAYATWSNPATITAPDITGLRFVNWTRTGSAYIKSGYSTTDKTIEVQASGAGTVTANYSQGPLFFKDTKSWGQVYIYFYNSTGYLYTCPTSNCSEGTGSSSTWEEGNKNKPFISGPHAMTLLEGTTDVYYYDGDIPANTAAYAFTKESLSNQSYFAGPNTSNPCSVVRVAHSINPDKPMIVPVGDGALWNINYARYYGHDEAPILTDWGYNLRGAFNEWSSSKSEFKAPTLGSLTFTTTAYLDAGNANYAWKVYNGNKGYGKGGDPVLTKSSPTSATLISADAAGNNLQVKSNIAGEYTFTLNYGIGTGTANTNGASLASTLLSNMTVTVTYPVVVGDYRLIYTGGTNPHPGNVIKKRADGEDIVSMYVASGKADKIKIHACTATDNTSVTWGSASAPTYGTDVYTAFTTLLSTEGSGVYDFTVTQDASGNPTITKVEKYTGRFYVRTNCVNDDKWNYRDSKDAHAMTYSEWSATKMTDTDMRFSHYYVDDLHGTGGSPINIRFTVATDNSEAICDTVFDGDASGKWKDYIHSENLSQTANVRFTYDEARNKVWRAYTEGPTNDNYMVLRSNGSDVFALDGSGGKGSASAAVKFSDMNNWVYQADVFANVNSYIKLTAQIGGVTQYLRGNTTDDDYDADDAEMLIGGSGSGLSAQHMRITYDFKTDRMTTSWIPSAAVSGTLDIHADIMLLRTHQDGASSITFNSGGKLTDIKTAYGVMEFQKTYINDYSRSRYERNLYWISFPFDVNLSDVFGFGKYGEHWIIEYYDGKGRAQKGYWAESEPNWKFVTEEVKDEFVLKANEGYILALALTNMGEYSDIWANSVTSVYLYFPSAKEIGSLADVSSVNVVMDTIGYKCNITRDSRNIKDSYWRCIGVPSYAQNTRTGLPTEEPDEWETKVPYVYVWNSANNSLSITSNDEITFKAMHSYLVQYPDDVIVWTAVTNKPAGVARRKIEGNEASFYEWNLNLLRNGEHQDHTYVRLTNDENATANFDFGQDVSKEFNNGANIYSFVEGVQAAGNVMPLETNVTKIVPVGVKITETGDYTFSMPDGTNGVGVVLIDNIAGTRTNLALEDYIINLATGIYDGRFFLEISPIVQSPTGIEQTGSDSKDSVRKVMVDGILYIIKDGKVFDARGSRLQ